MGTRLKSCPKRGDAVVTPLLLRVKPPAPALGIQDRASTGVGSHAWCGYRDFEMTSAHGKLDKFAPRCASAPHNEYYVTPRHK
jgi:hypothetical protein